MSQARVSSVAELNAAPASGATGIEVVGSLRGMPSLTLPPGIGLYGGELVFGAKDLRLTSNNTVQDITIRTAAHELAIYNDAGVEDLGTLRLVNVSTHGQVYLCAQGSVRSGRIETDGVHVLEADTRGRAERPTGFGVEALQGAFTVWNRQPDPLVDIGARLENISAGRDGAPVRGGGVFVGGHGVLAGNGDGGTLTVDLLSTGTVFSDGGRRPDHCGPGGSAGCVGGRRQGDGPRSGIGRATPGRCPGTGPEAGRAGSGRGTEMVRV